MTLSAVVEPPSNTETQLNVSAQLQAFPCPLVSKSFLS